MLSGSRAAFLALLVALAFLFVRRKRVGHGRRASWTVRITAVVLALIGTVAFFLSPFGLTIIEGFVISNLAPASRQPGAQEAIYLADRDVIFQHAFSTATQHPAAGLGVGSYRGPFGEEYPHNLVLMYAVDAGIVAAGLLLAFIVHFSWRSLAARAQWGVGAATTGGFLLIASLFAGSYYDARVFWFMSFALTAAHAVRRPGARPPAGPIALHSRAGS
jgi:O-antigen ligase